MVVQHNMQAMNANRMLNITTNAQAKSTEKLSSGYRINRAADDAAGLSISEKMRKQIKGLDKASSNAQDGISAVQTAEGALTEVHSMLQRMNELATQAANGTNSASDRQSIQDEIDQLTTEIDRVAETTKFNETYLLKGDAAGTKSEKFVNAHDAGIAGTLGESEKGKTTFTLKDKLESGSKITVGGETLTIGDSKSADDYAKLSEIGDTLIQLNDKYIKADGTEMTVTDKATNEDIRKFLAVTIEHATTLNNSPLGTLTLEDGTSYTIGKGAQHNATITKVTADGTTSSKTTTIAAATATIADIIGEDVNLAGATFTTADEANVYTMETQLNREELSTFDVSTGTKVVDAATNSTTLNSVLGLKANGETEVKAGDSVTTYVTNGSDKVETTKTAYADLTRKDYAGVQEIHKGDEILGDNGVRYALTDKATDADITSFLVSKTTTTGSPDPNLGRLTLADGTTYDFTESGANNDKKIKVSKNGATAAETGDISSATDLKTIVNEATLNLKGATFTDADGNVFAVGDLESGEATMFNATSGKLAAAASGVVNVGSNATNGLTAAGASYYVAGSKAGTIDMNSLASELNKLNVGAKISVTSADGKTTAEYTIAGEKSQENGNTLTVDSILGKLKEADQVGWDTNDVGSAIDATETYTVVGVDAEEGTTSVKDAYKKIAEELSKASSIGTDKAATVTSNGDGSFVINQGTVEVTDALNFGLHVGADADMTNKISVDIQTMDSASLGIKGIDISDDTGVKATYAIDAIADAISKVSAQRSALGAVQNRLEHTISNLDNVVENTTSAESSIRDTDMAEEMVNYSKNNILAQAGQSMLAQANQSNQGVLSLLG